MKKNTLKTRKTQSDSKRTIESNEFNTVGKKKGKKKLDQKRKKEIKAAMSGQNRV